MLLQYPALAKIVLLLTAFAGILSTHAQSGRKPREGVEIPPVQTATSESFQKPRALFEPTGGKYQLVFARDYPGKLEYGKKEAVDYTALRHDRLDSFIRELNIAGREGFRLSAVTGAWNPVAFSVHSEEKYEYQWFETVSWRKFEKLGLNEKVEELQKEGYRIAAQLLTNTICQTETDSTGMTTGEICELIDLFIAERRLDKSMPVRQKIVSHSRKPGKKPSEEMSTEITALLADGYYPVQAVSQLEVLLEKGVGTPPKDSDIRVVRSPDGRGQLRKRVNELARQGYRLALANNGVALLVKEKGTVGSYKYHFVDAINRTMMLTMKPRDISQDVAHLQSSGARFLTTYPDFLGNESVVIFEEAQSARPNSNEFRILEISFDATAVVDKYEIHRELTNSTKANLDTLNKLVDAGYEVRDLFVSDTIKVILERTGQE